MKNAKDAKDDRDKEYGSLLSSGGGGGGCLIIVIILFIIISFTVSAQAGIFRPGKVFPLWRDRPGYEPNQPNPQPLPPPIIDPSLLPVPVPQLKPVPQISKEEIVKEVVEAIVAVEQDKIEEPLPTQKVPPWLPLGGIAGGGIITLLGFARKGLSQIRGG